MESVDYINVAAPWRIKWCTGFQLPMPIQFVAVSSVAYSKILSLYFYTGVKFLWTREFGSPVHP